MNLCVVTKGTFTKDDYMELYNYFKDWSPLSTFYPKLKDSQKIKNGSRVAMVAIIAASLELAKQGEISLKQEYEFGEIFLKKKRKI